MLQLAIVVLTGAVLYFVFKGRKIDSDKGNFGGEIVAVALLSVALGAVASVTPAILPWTSSIAENALKAEYEGVKVGSGTVQSKKEVPREDDTNTGTKTAGASTSSLTPSSEGMRLMKKHFPNVKYEKGDGKLTNLVDVGDGWFWNVIDPGLSATVGQKVITDEYILSDPSAGVPTVYLARVQGKVTEYGDPRPRPLK